MVKRKHWILVTFAFVLLIRVSGDVPDTDSFSLSDVESEISGTQGSLNSCFNDANSEYYDYSYYDESDGLSLLDFRNYGVSNTYGCILEGSPTTFLFNYTRTTDECIVNISPSDIAPIIEKNVTWLSYDYDIPTEVLEITAEENQDPLLRTGTITLTHPNDSGESFDITISQKAEP